MHKYVKTFRTYFIHHQLKMTILPGGVGARSYQMWGLSCNVSVTKNALQCVLHILHWHDKDWISPDHGPSPHSTGVYSVQRNYQFVAECRSHRLQNFRTLRILVSAH